LKGQNEAWVLRIVAENGRALFNVSLIPFEIHLQADLTLATGRDCPIKMGNCAPSAGAHLINLQSSFTVVLDSKVVDDLLPFHCFPKTESGLGDFHGRNLLRG
jgi:hypothetical protein